MLFRHIGGTWHIEDFDLKLIIHNNSSGSTIHPGAISSTSGLGTIYVQNTNITIEDNTTKTEDSKTAQSGEVRVFSLTGGKLGIYGSSPNFPGPANNMTWSRTGTGIMSFKWFYATNTSSVVGGFSGGSGTLENTYGTGATRWDSPVINVKGAFTAFAHLDLGSVWRGTGTSPNVAIYFKGDSTATGTRYVLNYGSSVLSRYKDVYKNRQDGENWISERVLNSQYEYFPGDRDGTMTGEGNNIY
jgi:hypothetical protein